jgi:hypothetical protein
MRVHRDWNRQSNDRQKRHHGEPHWNSGYRSRCKDRRANHPQKPNADGSHWYEDQGGNVTYRLERKWIARGRYELRIKNRNHPTRHSPTDVRKKMQVKGRRPEKTRKNNDAAHERRFWTNRAAVRA